MSIYTLLFDIHPRVTDWDQIANNPAHNATRSPPQPDGLRPQEVRCIGEEQQGRPMGKSVRLGDFKYCPLTGLTEMTTEKRGDIPVHSPAGIDSRAHYPALALPL